MSPAPTDLHVLCVVGPSRRLRACLCALALVQLLAALWCARLAPLWTGLPLAAALCALGRAARPAPACRLALFGPGAPPLTVQEGAAAPRAAQLLPGTVCWPGLLALRLSGAGPGLLLVLPDSIAPGQWRRLCVAVRALAAATRTELFSGAGFQPRGPQ